MQILLHKVNEAECRGGYETVLFLSLSEEG